MVTGILRDLPHNTQLRAADLFMPNTSKADTMHPDAKTSWLSVQGWGYVKLAPGADPAARGGASSRPSLDKSIDVKKASEREPARQPCCCICT